MMFLGEKEMYKNIILLLSVLVFVACGGGGGGGGEAATDTRLTYQDIAPPPFTGGSGRKIVTGDQLGNGTKFNSDLIYAAPVITNTSDFSIGPAYVENRYALGQLIIPITNLGSPKCNIKANLIELRGSGNSLIDSNSLGSDVTGSNATFYRVDIYQYIDDSIFEVSTVNHCLDTGETGYFLEYASGLTPRGVSFVSVNDIESQEYETCDEVGCNFLTFYAPSQSWEPKSYNIISPNSFGVSILNTSTEEESCCGSILSQYLLFDSDDKPLAWGYLNNYDSSGIPVGGTGKIIEDNYIFDGVSTKIEVFVNYY